MDNEKQNPEMPQMTKGVQTLLGNPKKAIINLSIPMIIAMSLNALYNLVDRFWVSGLGEDALAATGFFMPFFFLAMAVATGIGIGGSAVASRRIGARDKKGAESSALHTLLFSLILSVVFTIPLLLLSPTIFKLMGATTSLDETISYGTIMFAGIIFLFFSNSANAVLRSEGNATKAMIAMLVGTILNIILDPVFIFIFDMGVAGAAIATVLSIAISCVLLLYWLFIEKKSFLAFDPRAFKFSKTITKEIFTIGFPTILSQGSMSIMMFFIIFILQFIADDRAVAVYTAGWTIVAVAILPLLGIATAVISVSAAALGAKDIAKVKIVHTFSTKTGLIIETFIAFLAFIGAPFIARIFTWSSITSGMENDIFLFMSRIFHHILTGSPPGSVGAGLEHDIALFMMIICFYFPAAAGGIMANALFQGIRMAIRSLIITLLRTVVFALFFTWLFGIALGYGIAGVYVGMVVSIVLSSIIGFIWARISIHNLGLKYSVLDSVTEKR